MMNFVRIALVFLLVQTPQARQQNAVVGAYVEGVVVDRVSGATLSGINVELSGIVGTKVETYSAITDKTGKFSFKNVVPASGYWLVASPHREDQSHMRAVFGQRGLTGPGTQIALKSGEQLKDVRLALFPTGTISGRVLNEKGNPAANQRVMAIGASYSGGPWARDSSDKYRVNTSTVAAAGSAQTNGHGEYRIAGLPPGQYYVSVGGSRNILNSPLVALTGAPGLLAPSNFAGYYGSTFFPGATNPWDAKPIDVRAGSTVDNRDIQIAPVRLRRIRGTVLDDASGTPVSSAQLLLVPRHAPPDSGATRALAINKGVFEIDSVLPGPYFIVAFANGKERTLLGRASVDMDRDNIDNVIVRVSSGLEVPAHIVFDRINGDRDAEILRPAFGFGPSRLRSPDSCKGLRRQPLR